MRKSWLHSKTIWFNFLTVVIVVATFFGFQEDPEIAEQSRAIIVSLAPLVNIILRIVTTKAIF